MKRIFILISSLIPFLTDAQNIELETRVETVLKGLSIDEKIGQLTQWDGRKKLETLKNGIRKGEITSLMNITDPEVANELQRVAVEESPSGIPIIFARDIIHGFATILPIPLGQAASFDEELIEKTARNAAIEATEQGIRLAFAPMMDISRDPRWGRICESLGEDTYLSGRLAAAVVRGYQGEYLSAPSSMAACAKHFAGYGASEGGRDYNTTYVPPRELRNTHLPPFKACIEEGCASIMASFNNNDGLPSTCNHHLLTEILRDEWKFDGVVFSDWSSVSDVITFGIAKDRYDAARKCINAGCDVDMVSNCYLRSLKDLIEKGEVTMETLDEAVRRVLRLKMKLGLFDSPYTKIPEQSSLYSDTVLSDACRLAEESIVMLKNESVLPLGPDIKKIVLTGPMAHAAYDQMGSWSLDGDKKHVITPLMAISNELGDKVEIEYIPCLAFPRDSSDREFKKLEKAARKADMVIAFVGEEAAMSGEAHSLSSLNLHGRQTEMLEMLSRTETPLVTIVMAGRPLTIAREADMSDALLYAWHPGTMGGPAIANIILGKTNPSGKLPVTFPRNVGQIPIYYNYLPSSRRPKGTEGDINKVPREAAQSVMGHTCSYIDVAPTPLFPFGFGLSYTTFNLSDIRIDTPIVEAGDTVKVSAVIKNTGRIKGTEVVQLYIGLKNASIVRPVKELKDFRRVTLSPGESKRIQFEIPVSRLAFYNQEMRFVTEPGKYTVTIGTDSQSGQTGSFEIISGMRSIP